MGSGRRIAEMGQRMAALETALARLEAVTEANLAAGRTSPHYPRRLASQRVEHLWIEEER